MSDKDDVFQPHKLADAVPHAEPHGHGQSPRDTPTPATTAEQQRELEEGRHAHEAQAGLKDRLIEIGKASQLGGHGQGRVGDS